MENFGDYITNEYAILKQILNNLTLTDLLTARKVCRGWHKCALHILGQRERGRQSALSLHRSAVPGQERALGQRCERTRHSDSLLEAPGRRRGNDPAGDQRNQCWVSFSGNNRMMALDQLEPDEEIIRELDEECGLQPPTALDRIQLHGTIWICPKQLL
ncbi:hypothetical protein LSTR_LSTR016909 [Laodelphax striatellus]|uniref:F-box domain-containing protein n=1 Tax=Laodelphax striatellus TaxID=195883 RepID=A0A482X760_LAOST|nr:hypothetical protein LSTR_LSTR016909 [Laodelphax striatellus]